MQIGPADSAISHTHQNFARVRFTVRNLSVLERLRFNRSGSDQNTCSHRSLRSLPRRARQDSNLAATEIIHHQSCTCEKARFDTLPGNSKSAAVSKGFLDKSRSILLGRGLCVYATELERGGMSFETFCRQGHRMSLGAFPPVKKSIPKGLS
jgi:hypothetical protein